MSVLTPQPLRRLCPSLVSGAGSLSAASDLSRGVRHCESGPESRKGPPLLWQTKYYSTEDLMGQATHAGVDLCEVPDMVCASFICLHLSAWFDRWVLAQTSTLHILKGP